VYAGNNPLVMVDPDGEWFFFALAAAIGGYSGYNIGKSLGQTGINLAFSTLFGAALGAASYGLGTAVESAVTGTMGLASGSGALGTTVGGVAGGTAGGAISGLGTGIMADMDDTKLWAQTYRTGLTSGVSAGLLNLSHFHLSPKFQWSVHETVLEYAEKQYGNTGRQFYRYKAVEYIAKMQGIPVDRVVYDPSLTFVDDKWVYGAVDPPLYDLGRVGPNAFLAESGVFDAGNLRATTYHEWQHVFMSRGADFLSQSPEIINQKILFQEIEIRELLFQHKYYKFWSIFTKREMMAFMKY
jgi:hypothetical protein